MEKTKDVPRYKIENDNIVFEVPINQEFSIPKEICEKMGWRIPVTFSVKIEPLKIVKKTVIDVELQKLDVAKEYPEKSQSSLAGRDDNPA